MRLYNVEFVMKDFIEQVLTAQVVINSVVIAQENMKIIALIADLI